MRNKEGFTWREWVRAVGQIYIQNTETLRKMRKAWEDGEDPTEWRASFLGQPKNINPLIEQLRDIYCGRDTYDSEREWLDNLNATMKDLCDGVGIDFRPQ